MLIVSQDEKQLMSLNTMEGIRVDECSRETRILIFYADRWTITLGIYKTEERAREVLAEIVNEYKNRIPDQNTVYYMPKE